MKPVQKFLVANSIGGLLLNWETILYLADRIPERKAELIAKAAYEFENDGGERLPRISYCSDSFRNMLIQFVETLDGNYAELDEVNGGCRLRVVEVPYGHSCYIFEDSELGIESVEEWHESWRPPQDERLKFRIALDKMLQGYKYSQENSYIENEDKTIQCVFTEKYGLAKTPLGYCPLKLVTYYSGGQMTDECSSRYERCLDNINAGLFHVETMGTIPSDEFVEYVELYRNLERKSTRL